jgi:hypothetical protein
MLSVKVGKGLFFQVQRETSYFREPYRYFTEDGGKHATKLSVIHEALLYVKEFGLLFHDRSLVAAR